MQQNKRNSRRRRGEMPTTGLWEKINGDGQTRDAGNVRDMGECKEWTRWIQKQNWRRVV